MTFSFTDRTAAVTGQGFLVDGGMTRKLIYAEQE